MAKKFYLQMLIRQLVCAGYNRASIRGDGQPPPNGRERTPSIFRSRVHALPLQDEAEGHVGEGAGGPEGDEED